MDSIKLELIENVAKQLILINGKTTTKEVKEELRKSYPGRWYQSEISDAMNELSIVQNKLKYYDNGTFHEYYVPEPPKESLVQRFLNFFKK